MGKKVIGVLEALEYAERIGANALTTEERSFMKHARKMKGCLMVRRQLTVEEILRVIELGEKCRQFEERKR